jgi:hypothetical protein
MYASSTDSGDTPAIHIIVVVVSPTTLPEPAGVRRGDDRREIADVHLAAEHHARDRAADQRRGDVVEERRQHEDHRRAARSRPSSRRAAIGAATPAPGWPRNASTAARSRREAEQVREQHPLVAEVREEAAESRAFAERRPHELVERDRASPVSATRSVW